MNQRDRAGLKALLLAALLAGAAAAEAGWMLRESARTLSSLEAACAAGAAPMGRF
ncbi:MAG: hypothetical protein PHU21_08665 [Elusimicrobia bacterium]|nr:hypothetical protein [Elusimicrobiota bacterium]